MAKRKIIEIDEEKCDGCGQCVVACEEGALQIVDGKAKVVNEVFCDGLGACIGECPQGALTIVEREAPEFDQEVVDKYLREHGGKAGAHAEGRSEPCGCPSATPMTLRSAQQVGHSPAVGSRLSNWPVQWRLVQPSSPFYKGADMLLAADCVPFAFGDFHREFLDGSPLIIGCPKLDEQGAFLDKLTALFREARPASVRIVMMEVPCCSGLVRLTEQAIAAANLHIPVKKTVIGIRGERLEG